MTFGTSLRSECIFTPNPHYMSKRQPTILLVDDNDEILSTMSMVLAKQDYKVHAKKRLLNFETEVASLSPDLIMLDKSLGWADGCDLCRALKQNRQLAPIPVIMLSAYGSRMQECLASGADWFIEKPFDLDQLLNSLRLFIPSA